MPLVTIGMSSYNYARYIKAALDSLLNQTYPHVELIIIDDYSTDNSVSIIESWIRDHHINCTFIVHTENKGITKTLNEMIKKSRGKYFVMFASDDIMLPERISRQVNVLEAANYEFGLCYSHPLRMDEEGVLIEPEKYTALNVRMNGDVIEAYIKRDFWFNPPSCMLLKSAIEKAGFYNEEVLIEDYNFFVRFLLFFKVIYCDYPAIIYRERRIKSDIVKEWDKNNGERYFYDRVISNVNAWKITRKRSVKKMLEIKIKQYITSLAVYNSPSFYKAILYLFKKRYFNIPPKVFLIKFTKSIGLYPPSEMRFPESQTWF